MRMIVEQLVEWRLAGETEVLGESLSRKVTLTLRCQLGVTAVRNEKLVAEAGDSSGTQRKWNVRRWKSLPSNG
jgi:hypothetical protein